MARKRQDLITEAALEIARAAELSAHRARAGALGGAASAASRRAAGTLRESCRRAARARWGKRTSCAD